MKKRFLAVYEHGKDGYSGSVLDLPGCVLTAGTLKEMQKRMRKAVKIHLHLLVTQGKEIPHPTTAIIEFPRPLDSSEDKHWVVEPLEVNVLASRRAKQAMTA
jgi:predicted RNase H-like HicB family nuclease